MGNQCCHGKPTDGELSPDKPAQDEMAQAATKIQAHFKGQQARKDVKKIKEDAEAEKKATENKKATPEPDMNLKDPELEQVATKIQAAFKGKQVRKQLKTDESKPAKDGEETLGSFAIPIKEVPDYSNANTKAAIAKFGAFNYENGAEISLATPHKLVKNSAIYTGQWKNQKRDGAGKQVWPDGSIFEGHWKDNKAHGKGRVIHPNGDVFEGEWVDGEVSKGKYSYVNGDVYEGGWAQTKEEDDEDCLKAGRKEGQGKYKYAEGLNLEYEGEYVDDMMNGKGVLIMRDGRKYTGEFLDDKMEGKNGVFVWNDGRKYEGDYFDDKKHGYGVFSWPDGRRYEGSWLYGKQHGKGAIILMENGERIKYNGEWEDGKRIRWFNKELADGRVLSIA